MSKYISTILLSRIAALGIMCLCCMTIYGQEVKKDSVTMKKDSITVPNDSTLEVLDSIADSKPTTPKDSTSNLESKFSKWVADIDEKKKLPLFQGFTISGDVFGLGMYLFGDYGTIEAALRLSLKNTYLPIVELGYGICDHTDYNTKIHYKVNAPFIRIGIDFNLLKDKFQDNRLFAGLRYGFSTYKYDMNGPDLVDPIYGGSQPFDFSGTTSTSQWLEIVLGCQVKVVKNFHMGWSVRLKYHLSSSKNDNSKAYYIPGYGTTGNNNTWSGSYNLIFDLNWGKKKKIKNEK